MTYLQRILKTLEGSNLDQALRQLPASDVQSLLIHVAQQRAKDRTLSDIRNQYAQNRFLRPTLADMRQLAAVQHLCYQRLPVSFETLALSPCAPFGLNNTLGNIPQNNVVTTTRNSEVRSDPTTMLALECAKRRQSLLKANPRDTTTVAFGGHYQLLRAQKFGPGMHQHFHVFTLCSAGRDTGGATFERNTIKEHIAFYIALAQALPTLGFKRPKTLALQLSDNRIMRHTAHQLGMNADRFQADVNNHPNTHFFERHAVALPHEVSRFKDMRPQLEALHVPAKVLYELRQAEEAIIEALASDFPDVTFTWKPGRTQSAFYYQTLCFTFFDASLEGYQDLADGGDTDWTSRLLNNRKERYVSSGIGTQRLYELYTPSAQQ